MSRTYLIPDENLATLRTKIAKLAARSQKLGCAPIELDVMGEFWTRATDASHGLPVSIVRVYHAVEVCGEAPVYEGWSLAARIENGEFLGDAVGAIVKTVPGVDLPAHLRADRVDATHCEHCSTNRRRKDTFACSHVDGRWVQVGRQCLRDFLGHASPESLAKGAEHLLDAVGACEEFEGDCGEPWTALYHGESYLSYVAGAIRSCGWVSKAAANERTPATAGIALHEMTRKPNQGRPLFSVRDEDCETARAALQWSQAWLAGDGLNDYQLNMRAALGSGVVSHRTMGIVASLIAAHRREIGRALERKREAQSVHVGTVKVRREFVLTLVRETGWESDYGYTNLYTFADPDGNCIIWKTGNSLRADHEPVRQGDTIKVKATVKEHSTYRGVAQTVVTRAKVLGRATAAAQAA